MNGDTDEGKRDTIDVFVAICTGSERMARDIDLPLVHVDASMDVTAAIARLNERRHGAGTTTPHPFWPLAFNEGWSDWRQLDYLPGRWCDAVDGVVAGVRVRDGRLRVALPGGTSPSEFRERLRAGLRHLRVQEVALDCRYMRRRLEEAEAYVVAPRYTGNGVDGTFDGAAVVDDLYVVDPDVSPWKLALKVVSARAEILVGGGR